MSRSLHPLCQVRTIIIFKEEKFNSMKRNLSNFLKTTTVSLTFLLVTSLFPFYLTAGPPSVHCRITTRPWAYSLLIDLASRSLLLTAH